MIVEETAVVVGSGMDVDEPVTARVVVGPVRRDVLVGNTGVVVLLPVMGGVVEGGAPGPGGDVLPGGVVVSTNVVVLVAGGTVVGGVWARADAIDAFVAMTAAITASTRQIRVSAVVLIGSRPRG